MREPNRTSKKISGPLLELSLLE